MLHKVLLVLLTQSTFVKHQAFCVFYHYEKGLLTYKILCIIDILFYQCFLFLHSSAIPISFLIFFSPNEDFNFGIALTSRILAVDELLEVQIEKVIDKWAGSLEIGVTTHAPGTFPLPGTMTNVASGTWMFSGGAIVHNSVTILEAYGRNIVSYKVLLGHY